MRRLLIVTILFLLVLGGLWLGGETLLARELRKLAAEDPAIEVAAVSELREFRRIGVHLTDLQIEKPAGSLTLPMLDLWLSPAHLTEARLALPPQAILDTGAGPMTLGLAEARGSLRLRPLGGMTLGSLALASGPLTVDDAPLAEALSLGAQVARLGHDTPAGAVAAYDLDIAILNFDLARLAPQLVLPGALGLEGKGRVWLDRAPGPATLSPGERPVPVGLRLDQADLKLGNAVVRISGRVQADSEGRTEGELTLSTSDIKPLLQAAASAGLIPEPAVKLAEAVWKKLATRHDAPETATPETAPSAGEDATETTGPELRLPVTFREGKIYLGPLPLGPAPLFPR
ncbi:MAG: DUF2125 domain-containing protein [Paracoccus sp.]|nr:DUF2125 domain-containing protein [Paracoccus sp. (in: a-proteobacteria)]